MFTVVSVFPFPASSNYYGPKKKLIAKVDIIKLTLFFNLVQIGSISTLDASLSFFCVFPRSWKYCTLDWILDFIFKLVQIGKLQRYTAVTYWVISTHYLTYLGQETKFGFYVYQPQKC